MSGTGREGSTVAAAPRSQEERLEALRALEPAFAERRRKYDDEAAFPTDNFRDLHAAGLLSLTIPEEYGGHGLWTGDRFVDFYELLEAAAHADSSTAQLLQVHSHATGVLSAWATPEQRDLYLPDIVANGRFVASAGSESNPHRASTGEETQELTKTDSGWVLNCQKYFASGSPGADYFLIWVAVPGAGPYQERMTLVIVPGTRPEVELLDEWDVVGMRATASHGVRITDYEVPDEALIGPPGEWVREPRSFTLGYATNFVGTGQAALDFASQWVRDRPFLQRSEVVQVTLGEMASTLFGARSAVYAAARTWEAGRYGEAEVRSLQALHLARAAGMELTYRAFDVCGARASFRYFPLEAMHRDLRVFSLHNRDSVDMHKVGDAMVDGFPVSSKLASAGRVQGA
jgi:alkylation response protein AidB-like acyl-CoA dehydrogenase